MTMTFAVQFSFGPRVSGRTELIKYSFLHQGISVESEVGNQWLS